MDNKELMEGIDEVKVQSAADAEDKAPRPILFPIKMGNPLESLSYEIHPEGGVTVYEMVKGEMKPWWNMTDSLFAVEFGIKLKRTPATIVTGYKVNGYGIKVATYHCNLCNHPRDLTGHYMITHLQAKDGLNEAAANTAVDLAYDNRSKTAK